MAPSQLTLVHEVVYKVLLAALQAAPLSFLFPTLHDGKVEFVNNLTHKCELEGRHGAEN